MHRLRCILQAAAFFTQALHHPAAATLLPGKMVQGPIASPALPLNCEQLAQDASPLADFVT
jgi:hypothetical protein